MKSPGADENDTGLPSVLPQTWRGVYVFVLATFALWAILLTILTWVYS